MNSSVKRDSIHKMITNITPLIIDLVDIIIIYIGNDPFDCFEGKFIDHLGSRKLRLRYPDGILAHNDKIYVCNTRDDEIIIMNYNGTILSKWKKDLVTGNNLFSYPINIIAHNSELYVSNYYSNNVLVFSLPHKHLVRTIHCNEQIWAIRIYKLHIYVSDITQPRILVYTLEGSLVREINCGLHCSRGICAFSIVNNNIHIIDRDKNDIICLSLDGTYKFRWGKDKFTQLCCIETFEPDKDICEFMYVNDIKGIHKYDFNCDKIKSWLFGNKVQGLNRFCFLYDKCFVTQWGTNKISVFM